MKVQLIEINERQYCICVNDYSQFYLLKLLVEYYQGYQVMNECHLTSSTVFKRIRLNSTNDGCFQSTKKLSLDMKYQQMHSSEYHKARFKKLMKDKSNFAKEKKVTTIIKKEKVEEFNVSPNKISIGFDIKKKNSKEDKKECPNKQEITNMIANSMRKYLEKVDRSKQAKMAKNLMVSEFGLDIRKINYEDSKKIMEKVTRIREDLVTSYNQSLELTLNETSVFKNHSRHKSKSIHSALKTTTPHCKNAVKITIREGDQEETIVNRVERLMNFYQIILYSFATFTRQHNINSLLLLKDNIPKKKIKSKYQYYVGGGNNKNLIISLMKKRWWWAQTTEITNADFVWTQLRVDSISEKHTKRKNYDIDNYKYVSKENSKETINMPTTPNNDAVLKIFHCNMKQIFHHRMRSEMERRFLHQIVRPNVLHNHYAANFMLGNKKALFSNLENYSHYKQQNVFDIVPLTFHIQDVESKSWEVFEQYVKQNGKSLWIIKPGENSNRGQGIWLSENIQQIKNQIKQMQSKHSFIIQKYVKNVFLFNRRKFDIRAYLLMVTIGGQYKFYWYSEGYIRTSSEIYNPNQLENQFIHLTNDAVQNKGGNYGKFEDGNKLSYRQFQRYLNTYYPHDKYSMNQLVLKMKEIAKKVIHATYPKIDPEKRQFGLQIFGMDFLIDANFRPWLLEVNTNPCLQLSSSCLERIIPRMLQNAFRIGLDPIFQPCCECPRSLLPYIPDNLIQRNRFQLIFDSIFDREFRWQQICNTQPTIKYENQDEIYEGDGSMLQIQN